MEIFPVYPAMCAVAIFLVLLPLPWHWKARNTGTLLYIGWTVLGCANFMVNTIIWRENFDDRLRVWCDISSKIIIGQSVGLTASSLCINRKLYNITTIKSVSESYSTKRLNAIIDLLLGIGLPIVVMVFHYVVQSNRHDIFEDIGCWPAVLSTFLVIPMVLIWPIILGVASLLYCSLSIRAFLQARQQLHQVFSNSHSGINISRYFRLMALASTEIIFSLPFAFYILVSDLQRNPHIPWISWGNTHRDFSRVDRYPMILVKTVHTTYIGFLINLWALPGVGFLFFIYFGLGGESLNAYRDFFYWLVGPLGIKPKSARPAQNVGWLNQVRSAATFTGESRDRTMYPSLPNLHESDMKTSHDLEEGKAHPL